jgi:hypothetical protein
MEDAILFCAVTFFLRARDTTSDVVPPYGFGRVRFVDIHTPFLLLPSTIHMIFDLFLEHVVARNYTQR